MLLHLYPRSNVAQHTASTGTTYNPVSGTKVSSTESFTASAANYNVTTGDCVVTISQNGDLIMLLVQLHLAGVLVLTIGTHGLTTGDRIKITPES